ncbi:hypothetical protein R5R35_006846 [Gryllus longicercus]|uniref:PHD-type domain-containing protein n=1 Tax=Gryllus longicercus TaxID=2509291 RepID=A0AAN9V3M8_9ORTH
MSEKIICSSCTGNIKSDRYAKCDSCNRSYHYDCVDISSTEQRCLELKGKRCLKFYCEDCEKGLRVLPEILTKLAALQQEIATLKSEGLRNPECANPSTAEAHDTVRFERTLKEFSERQLRSKNIIVYKVPESSHADSGKRRDEDKSKVAEILGSFNDDCPELQTVIRLEKKRDDQHPRPLKIVLRDSESVLKILRRKNLYEGTAKFSSDRTLQQRNYLKDLKQEVDLLNSIPGSEKKNHQVPKWFPGNCDAE